MMKTSLSVALALSIGAWAGAASVAGAQQLSAAERLYADLAKLPPAEREAKLIEGAKKEGEIYLIDTVRGRDGREYVKLFANRFPYLQVKASESGSQEAAERIVTEEAVGRHLTDAAMLAVPDMGEIVRKDLAARFPTPETKRILPRYGKTLDDQNRWVPFYTLNHGITYNPTVIPPDKAPRSWMDLCNPQYKGEMSFDPVETRFLVGLHEILGGEQKVKEWLECIGKNGPIVMRGHTARAMLMLAGDHGIGADQYLYMGSRRNLENPKKAPFKVVYEAPIMTWAGGIVINRNTPRAHASGLLGDWALSDESQKYQAGLWRGPLTLPHPFLPEQVTSIVLGWVEKDLVDRLHGYWDMHMSKARQ